MTTPSKDDRRALRQVNELIARDGMTPHEKECALAAIAGRIEKAKTTKELKEWRAYYREILAAPIE